MNEPEQAPRTCAHCGAASSGPDLYCPSCGQAFIPDPDLPGSAHDEPHAASGQRGGASREPGSASGEPGNGPGQAGPASREPGADQHQGWSPPGASQPSLPDSSALQPNAESRNWALGAHLSALAGALMGGLPAFLGPLVIWLLRRDQGDVFAAEHARMALNFNLSVIAYMIAAIVLTIVTLGLGLIVILPAALVAVVLYFVATVMGAVAASQGRPFRYPLAIPFV